MAEVLNLITTLVRSVVMTALNLVKTLLTKSLENTSILKH